MTDDEFRSLITDGTGDYRQDLRLIYKEACDRVTCAWTADDPDLVPPDLPPTWGMPRRALNLSVELLKAMLQGRFVEEVLQRTLVSVMPGIGNNPIWFNEFNVAGGLGDGSDYNRVAVDLGRVTAQGDRSNPSLSLDLFELKEWANNNDTPGKAARQVFWYASLYLSIVLQVRGSLDKLKAVRLAAMAPDAYFMLHGYAPPKCLGTRVLTSLHVLGQLRVRNQFFDGFHEALENLKREYRELRRVTFQAPAVVLPPSLDRQAFLDCFNRRRMIRDYIDKGQSAPDPREVLAHGSEQRLRQWLSEALDNSNL